MTLRNYIIIAALGSVLAVRAQEEPAAPVFRPPFDFPLIPVSYTHLTLPTKA